MSEATAKPFSADMPVAEATAKHPRVGEVFAAFQLGACAHCMMSRMESIGQVCDAYGGETDTLLSVLEELMERDAPQGGCSSSCCC